jgi:CRP-like cAMP-binding protein
MPDLQNHLLLELPAEEVDRLRPFLEKVVLATREVVIHPNADIAYIYFLQSGLASEVIVRDGEPVIEVGVIGRDGVVGLPVVLGHAMSPHLVFMQIGGLALRMPTQPFRQALQSSEVLRAKLLSYTNDFMLQLAETIYANGRLKIEPRLARWLLMSSERIDNDVVPLTHDSLRLMLGIRRAGVTEALKALEKKGLVRTSRAGIDVIDREGLDDLSRGDDPRNSVSTKPDRFIA